MWGGGQISAWPPRKVTNSWDVSWELSWEVSPRSLVCPLVDSLEGQYRPEERRCTASGSLSEGGCPLEALRGSFASEIPIREPPRGHLGGSGILRALESGRAPFMPCDRKLLHN